MSFMVDGSFLPFQLLKRLKHRPPQIINFLSTANNMRRNHDHQLGADPGLSLGVDQLAQNRDVARQGYLADPRAITFLDQTTDDHGLAGDLPTSSATEFDAGAYLTVGGV